MRTAPERRNHNKRRLNSHRGKATQVNTISQFHRIAKQRNQTRRRIGEQSHPLTRKGTAGDKHAQWHTGASFFFFVCACVFAAECVDACMVGCASAYVLMCVCMCVCLFYIPTYVHTHIHIHIYVYMYICIYVYIYIHI